MYRRFTKTALVIALAVVVVLGTTFTASADTQYVFNFPISRPQIGDNIAYLEVLYTRTNGSRVDGEVLIVSMPSDYHYDDGGNPAIDIDIFNSSIKFSQTSYTIDFQPTMNFFYSSTYGNTGFLDSNYDTYEIDYGKILGVHVYGDVRVSSNINNNGNFIFNYGTDSLAYTQLNTIISILKNQSNRDIIENNNSNTDKITGNQNQNTQDIIDNDKENTGAIIDNQNQIVENEKNEINDSGNSSVGNIQSVVPDVGISTLTGGLNKIVSSVSTHSLYCQWEFPAIKLPKINGVIENEVVLTESKTIDLGGMVQKIPDRYMTLTRSICTVGLILFIVYELHSFILYCFTLKSNQGGKEDGEGD